MARVIAPDKTLEQTRLLARRHARAIVRQSYNNAPAARRGVQHYIIEIIEQIGKKPRRQILIPGMTRPGTISTCSAIPAAWKEGS